jgi:hypothetical protein
MKIQILRLDFGDAYAQRCDDISEMKSIFVLLFRYAIAIIVAVLTSVVSFLILAIVSATVIEGFVIDGHIVRDCIGFVVFALAGFLSVFIGALFLKEEWRRGGSVILSGFVILSSLFWIRWAYIIPPKGIPIGFWLLTLGCAPAVIFSFFPRRPKIGIT